MSIRLRSVECANVLGSRTAEISATGAVREQPHLEEFEKKGYVIVHFGEFPDIDQFNKAIRDIYGKGELSKDLVNEFGFDFEEMGSSQSQSTGSGSQPESETGGDERNPPVAELPLEITVIEKTMDRKGRVVEKEITETKPEVWRDALYSRDQLVFYSEHPNGKPQQGIEWLMEKWAAPVRRKQFEKSSAFATKWLDACIRKLFFDDEWKQTRWVEYGILGCRSYGCPRQSPHTDFDVKKINEQFPSHIYSQKDKPMVMLYALDDNTRIYLRYPCEEGVYGNLGTFVSEGKNEWGEETVFIPKNHAIFFAGDVAHAGAEYKKANIRVHAYIGVKDPENPTKDISFDGFSTSQLLCMDKRSYDAIGKRIKDLQHGIYRKAEKLQKEMEQEV